MVDKKTLLKKFELQTKTVHIEAIDGDVKIKKLSIAQRQEVNEVLFGDATFSGDAANVEIEVTRYNKAAKLGVSFGLVEPSLSVDEIEQMSEDANDFILEVFGSIQEFDTPKK